MYSRILIPCDVSLESSEWIQPVIEEALRNLEPSSGRLYILTVVPTASLESTHSKLIELQLVLLAKKKLLSIAEEYVPANIDVQIEVKRGNVSAEIVSVARAWPADLIVMAPHDPTLQDRQMGSDAAKIVSNAPCSVMVLRSAKEPESAKREGAA